MPIRKQKVAVVSSLSLRTGWLLLVFLVFWDAFITFRGLMKYGGSEGNPLWRPLVDFFGPHALWFLAVLVLILFYGVVRIVGWYVERFEHMSPGEGVVLTSFVLAFAAYDVYITFFLQKYLFLGSRSHYMVIPVLIVPVLAYNLFVEWQRRRARKE